jgi:hypothetical protein
VALFHITSAILQRPTIYLHRLSLSATERMHSICQLSSPAISKILHGQRTDDDSDNSRSDPV